MKILHLYTLVPTIMKGIIQEKFGDMNLHTNFDIVLSARKGLQPKIFYDFAEAIKMPEKKLASIMNLSARTISNYKESEKRLDPPYGEHLLKLIALYKKGEMLFGTIDEFNYWLQKPFWFSQERPLDFLSTSGGVDHIDDELERLAQGYPV